MNLKKLGILGLVLALILFGVGCSSILSGVKEKAKSELEKSTGVKIDEKNKKVTVKGKDGQTEFSAKEGELPDNFPKQFPIFKGAKVISGYSASDPKQGQVYYVNWETTSPAKEVADFYKTELPKSGYKITTDATADKTTTYVLDKGSVSIVDKGSKVEIMAVAAEKAEK